MADVVQYRLERMVDELDDLESRGLFSRREIAEIVKKRRDFEYRLKRPCPIKQDYLSYIDYEKQLDALRRLRKRAIIGEMKKIRAAEEEGEGEGAEEDGGKKGRRRNKGEKLWKRSISDTAGVARIMDVYRKVTVRYKGDLGLWFQYLEFCRKCRNGRMKQVLAQAIRFHPKVPGLWMYAAAWEFDENLNVAAARALMQGGLRACPESEDLWIEYLRMELTYLNKLKARKVALGEDVKTLLKDNGSNKEMTKWKEENKDLFMPLNEEKGELKDPYQHEDALDKKENFFWEQGSNILRAMYQGAADALPSSMNLRKRFLEILDEMDLAHSDELKKEVMEDMKENFSNDEAYWDWLARFQVHDDEIGNDLPKEEVVYKLNNVVQVYEDALKYVPSTKMFSYYAKFLVDIIAPGITDGKLHLDRGIENEELISCLLKVYEKAEFGGCLSEDLAYQYILFYSNMGRLEEARELAGRLCDISFPQSAKLWVLRVSIEMKWLINKSTSLNDGDLNYVFKLLTCALAKSTFSESKTLCLAALKWFSDKKDYYNKLLETFIASLARAGSDETADYVSSAIVSRVLQRDGIHRAREMYKRLLALPHPSLSLFKQCIELESNLASIGDASSTANARRLYESALNIYGHDRELWKNYYSMEIKVGTSETANAVYWRARKGLGDATGLSVSNYIC